MILALPCFMFAGEMGDGDSKVPEAEEGKKPAFLPSWVNTLSSVPEKNLEEIKISLSNKTRDRLSQGWLKKQWLGVTRRHCRFLPFPRWHPTNQAGSAAGCWCGCAPRSRLCPEECFQLSLTSNQASLNGVALAKFASSSFPIFASLCINDSFAE